MYSDEFDDLEETRKGPRRAYVSSVSQHDADRVLRENERLKKSLEKEKFFNRLLDQELKDVKEEAANRTSGDPHRGARQGVSTGAFYTVLVVCLAMAGFIAYTLYYNKQYNLFNGAPSSLMPASALDQSVAPPANGPDEGPEVAGEADLPPGGDLAATAGSAGSGNAAAGAAGTSSVSTPVSAAANPTATRDSVPNIIGRAAAPAPAASGTRRSVASPAETEYDEAEVEALLAGLPPESSQSRPVVTAVTPPAPVVDRRPVIGRYYVTSKANFYTSPDENTLRNVFISEGSDKTVAALEDRNGFIYVEYKNDRGYTTRGWLSKRDLTKAE